MTAPDKLCIVPSQGTILKDIVPEGHDTIDKKIAALEVLHYNIGARLSKTKIRCMHVYNYADIVPLVDDHTLIPSDAIR